MKKVTLKLTDAETRLLGTQRGLGNVQQILVSNPLSVDGKKWTEHTIEVLNVNKFREFLNDEIKDVDGSWKRITIVDYTNLKSILSKLDKATDKPEENKIYALTGGPNDKCIANGDSWKDSVVQNDDKVGS